VKISNTLSRYLLQKQEMILLSLYSIPSILTCNCVTSLDLSKCSLRKTGYLSISAIFFIGTKTNQTCFSAKKILLLHILPATNCQLDQSSWRNASSWLKHYFFSHVYLDVEWWEGIPNCACAKSAWIAIIAAEISTCASV